VKNINIILSKERCYSKRCWQDCDKWRIWAIWNFYFCL